MAALSRHTRGSIPGDGAHVRLQDVRNGSALGDLLRQGVLLIFNAGRNSIVALDPDTGNLIDPDFVLTADLGFGSKPFALMHPDGERLLLSHQTANVVHAFDTDGDYLGVFAPAGTEQKDVHSLRKALFRGRLCSMKAQARKRIA